MITKPLLRISLVLFVIASLLFLPRFSYAEPPLADDNNITGQWDLNLTLRCTNFRASPKRTFEISLKKQQINLTWHEPSTDPVNYVPGYATFTTANPTGTGLKGELSFDFPYNFKNAGQCDDQNIDCVVDANSQVIDGFLNADNVISKKFIGKCKLDLQGYWKKFSDTIRKRNKIKGWGKGFCWEDGTVDTDSPSLGSFAGMCDVDWNARWRKPLP